MAKEREYKTAKRCCYISIVMMVLAGVLACLTGYNYFVGDADDGRDHQFFIAIIDLVLFCTIYLRNRKNMRTLPPPSL